MHRDAFYNPHPGRPAGCFLAEVIEVEAGRVRVEILNWDDANREDQVDPADALWARVAVPFAGDGRGAFFVPDVGDEVLVTFVNGDPRAAVVIGSLWNGSHEIPETIDGEVDRWTLVGKQGTRIAIVEEESPTISLTTPGGVEITLSDEDGGKIELIAGPNTVTLDSEGVSVSTSKHKTDAGEVEVSAGQVKFDTAQAKFSAIVDCQLLKATAANADMVRTAVGNIW